MRFGVEQLIEQRRAVQARHQMILAVSDEGLRAKLVAARKSAAEKVLAKNAEISAKYGL